MNTITKTKNIIIIVLIHLVCIACENNVEEETAPVNGEDTCDTAISFSSDVKSIIDTNCITCHNGNQFPDLRTFEGVSNNATSVRTQVVSRRMPLGGSLSNEEIELIRCWIDSGALNN